MQSPQSYPLESLVPLITSLPTLLQLLPIILQAAKIKHDRILLSRHIRSKNPAVRLLEQTVVRELLAELRPTLLCFGRCLNHSRRRRAILAVRFSALDELCDPLDVCLEGGRYIRERTVGAGDHESVGKVGDADAEVRRGTGLGPVFFEGLAFAAFDGDAGILGNRI